MKDRDQRAGFQADLRADPSQGDAFQVVHRGGVGDQLVSVEAFGQNPGGPRLNVAATAGAIRFGRSIEEAPGLQGAALDDHPIPDPFAG
jgi:hypothetical protein